MQADGAPREQQAQELASCIPHEDNRLRPGRDARVEAQESSGDGHPQAGHDKDRGLARHRREDAVGKQCEQAYGAGQAVDPVGHVERIHDPDHGKHRQRRRPDPERKQAFPQQLAEMEEHGAVEIDQRGRGEDLEAEFRHRAQFVKVVDDPAHKDDDDRGRKSGPHPHAPGHGEAAIGRQEHPAHHDPADQRHLALVDPAARGDREQPPPGRLAQKHRDGEHGRYKRTQKCQHFRHVMNRQADAVLR